MSNQKEQQRGRSQDDRSQHEQHQQETRNYGKLMIYTIIGMYVFPKCLYDIWTGFVIVDVFRLLYGSFVFAALIIAFWIARRQLL